MRFGIDFGRVYRLAARDLPRPEVRSDLAAARGHQASKLCSSPSNSYKSRKVVQGISRSGDSFSANKRGAPRFPREQGAPSEGPLPNRVWIGPVRGSGPTAGHWVKRGRSLRWPAADSDDADRRPVASRSPFHGPVSSPTAGLDCRARAIGAGGFHGKCAGAFPELGRQPTGGRV